MAWGVWVVVEKGIVEKYHPEPLWWSLGEHNPNFGNNYLETPPWVVAALALAAESSRWALSP
jgi:hypothetical protein